ncbi:DEAD/DEAH box helicase [Nitriliruptoria bacterium AS10]|nr:DEAD/DEAH box helicase [Salsipaludibacter albus]
MPADLATELDRLGIDAPFPIQSVTIPEALAGRDVSGCAPTGSGKTLAFSIPTIARVERARSRRPAALVLTPTRELAAQVAETMAPLATRRDRRVATVYGGTNVKRDIARLTSGVDVLVATPGRLADLVQRGACDLSEVRIVVLDEADRMADMGFLPEVTRLLDQTSSERQTLLFSATLDGDVDVLVRRYQSDPVRHVSDDPVEEQGVVSHHFWSATSANRRPQTIEALRAVTPAIVFVRTKRGADRLAKQLAKAGVSTAAIHGNRNQNQRERALAQFADGRVQALVATDVAARGIHVDDVAMVLHYDLPGSDKDYVHRSGRTGRAGATGIVVTMVMEDQQKDARAIQRALDLPSGSAPMDVAALRDPAGQAPSGRRGTHARPATERSSDNGRGSGDTGKGGHGGNGRRRADAPSGGARSRSRRARSRSRR